MGITATTFALMARHLQPEGFGQLNLALVVTAVALALASLGLEGLVVHQLIRRPAVPGAVLGTALRLRLLASVVTVSGLAALAWFIPAWRTAFGPILLAGLSLLFSPLDVIDLCFQRHLDSRRTVLVRFATVLVSTGLRLALISAGAGVVAFAAMQIFEGGLLAAALIWSYRRSPYQGPRWTWDAAIAREFLHRGLPLALAGLLVALSLRFDQLLVRFWLGEAHAGVYFASAKLIEIALLTSSAFTLSLFPALSAGHTESPQAFGERLQAQFDAMSALGWSIALACTATAPWLIPFMYGDEYRAAVPVLIWKSWGTLLALNAAIRWQFILLAAPTWLNLLAAGLSIGCQGLLAPWVLPRWGLDGAAALWTLAVVLSGFVTTFLFPRLHPAAAAQSRSLLIPFAPARWPAMIAQFKS